MNIKEELKQAIESGTHKVNEGIAKTMEAMIMQRALDALERQEVIIGALMVERESLRFIIRENAVDTLAGRS